MKNVLIAIVVVVILAVAGAAGWFFLIKKSAEGGRCSNDSRCETDLKCLNQRCSSGQKGSSCTQKSDCQTGYCVNNLCTEGKAGNACATYKDCEEGLLCTKGACSVKPDYSKYFEKIQISKFKPGIPPGPDNVSVPTTEFKQTDGIGIDFIGVKPTTAGEFYYEFVNPITGEIIRSSKNEIGILKIEGQDRGAGTDLSNLSPGEYDLNIYFNNEFVYNSQITITQ